MIATNISLKRTISTVTALSSLGFAFTLALVQVPAARAAGSSALSALDDKAPSLPLAPTFDKAADPEKGPYVLSLKNTSSATIKVTAKVLLSVYMHGDDKARHVPEHAVDAGEVWTISGLAAQDEVILTADGFAPLQLRVP
jgi:hypothetical protein